MKLTVVLAVLIGILVVACSSAAPAPAEPTPNIDATVEAKLAQERAVEATVEARLEEERASQPTSIPSPTDTQAAMPTYTPHPTYTPEPSPEPTTPPSDTPIPAPTATPVLVVTPDADFILEKNGIRLIEWAPEVDDIGHVVIQGIVENVSNSKGPIVCIRFRWYDKAGFVLDESGSCGPGVPIGRKSRFEVPTFDNEDVVAEIELIEFGFR
jgi:hypothetical protein